MFTLAEFTLGDAIVETLTIFLIVVWIWILVTILNDLFHDHEVSGWAKAAWVVFLIFIPFLTGLVYLITRGEGMRERAIKRQADTRKQFDSYVRETAGTSPVDELTKLSALKEKGDITDADYEKMKAKLVS